MQFLMDWQFVMDWFESLQWERLVPELIGKALGFLSGFAASWFLLFRRRLNALQRMQSGDSDDFIFQMHHLSPVAGHADDVVLLFRNVAPKITLNDLYDNEAVRDVVKKIAEQTTLDDPILKTEGTLGFELLNDAVGHIAGLLATTPFPRKAWLFVMTCEDRQAVRKKCIRCFLIQPADLEKFVDWNWCQHHVLVEKPWHWFRVVALHRIACAWKAEQRVAMEQSTRSTELDMPLVDKQVRHDRVRVLSLGLNESESPIGEPHRIAWKSHLANLASMGLPLTTMASNPSNEANEIQANSGAAKEDKLLD
ncbi:hypothetical protein RMSM_01393 [Rhodopirellula maiorica SM1]|uniref:Uncharacterized protein n=1 Tax=Rhodopirellula maiorica SM1 TaxID=1265738 RepID=M5RQV5_9BACT|nr:hypothetical protein [Rhodopirellula maiorica]EMI21680.1 hypothetical protein RMSM_01393 [Rhodopirellula maiorica SM1]